MPSAKSTTHSAFFILSGALLAVDAAVDVRCLIGAAEDTVFEIIPGGLSGGGKYQALRVACEVPSLDKAHHIAELLSKAEGVKFVL